MSNTNHEAINLTLTEREQIAQARIGMLIGRKDFWLQEYATVLASPPPAAADKNPGKFYDYLRLVARVYYEHPEAGTACAAAGEDNVSRWLRRQRGAPQAAIDRLTPELRQAALKIATKLLDRPPPGTEFCDQFDQYRR